MKISGNPKPFTLDHLTLPSHPCVHRNIPPAELVEQVILRREGVLSNAGAVVVATGKHTGRSPEDKFIVKRDISECNDIWWGKVNKPFPPEAFNKLLEKVKNYLQGKEIFVSDLIAGAESEYQLPIRVITEKAWQALFAHNLFIRPSQEMLKQHDPGFTVVCCPDYLASPEEDGTRSSTFIGIDFQQKVLLIVGSSYAGEIKKSIFTVMNYLLPLKGVLSMHCSANMNAQNEVALFFGLSGTGKTTLSSDPERFLIGDDEHGWSSHGVFNFEGGCYAKTIKLKKEFEPLIWDACQRFGSVLENVTFHPATREVNFDSDELTENTRGAYPIDFIPNHVAAGKGGHPKHIFFLTADAFGVLPPIALLTPEQAMDFFLLGYTAKLAGTEKGLGKEPQATFSACFGAPFLPLPPKRYANLLGEFIERYKSRVWLINTGWTGGHYGTGQRIHLPYTRAMIRAALNSTLEGITMRKEPFFGLNVPLSCPGVDDALLDPRSTWQDLAAYDRQAASLAAQFKENLALVKN